MFSYRKASFSNLVFAPPVERAVEFSPPGMDAASVARVLTLAADGKTVSAEAGDGFAEVAGRVNFRLVYTDREGRPAGADYNADFSLRVEGDIRATDSVQAWVTVLEADVAAGDELTLSAVIEVRTVAVRREEAEMLTDAERCYKTTQLVALPVLVAARSTTFSLTDETEAGEVDKVVLADAQTEVVSARAETGKMIVEGKVIAAVTYVEDGVAETARFDIPFTEEIAAEGVCEGDEILATAAVKNGKVVLAGVTGANIVRYECGVTVRAQAFRTEESEIVSDLFMLTNETVIEREEVSFTEFTGMRRLTERITGVAAEENISSAVVEAVPYARCTAARTECTEDGLVVEGVLTADIVYRGEDGQGSVRAEVPFSLTAEGGSDGSACAECVVESVSAKFKKGVGFEVDAVAGMTVYCSKRGGATYISSVEAGAEKEQNTAAVSLYIAREGDTMWELCKEFTATPDEIMAQNPALTLPLAEGERVVYFRALSL